MAITISSQPANALYAVQQEMTGILYVIRLDYVTGSATRPAVDPRVEYDVEINGSVFRTLIAMVAVYSYPALNTHRYEFTIDIQTVLADFFRGGRGCLHDTFVAMSSPYTDASLQAEYRILCIEWLPNTDNILERNPLSLPSVNSNTAYAINAVTNPLDTQSLTAYDRQVLAPAAARWLTEKQDRDNVFCREDDDAMGVWAVGGDGGIGSGLIGLTYRAYNASGALISIATIVIAGVSNDGITVIGTGPINIETAVGWTLPPIFPPSNSAVASYTVELNGGAGNAVLARRYYLTDGCCGSTNRFRIYFRNRFGCYDSLTINQTDVLNYAVDSALFDKQDVFEDATVAKQRVRLQAFARESREGLVLRIRKDQVQWYKQLVRSTDVYIQSQPYAGSSGLFYIPVTIEDATFKLVDKSDKPVQLRFNMVFSNREVSQRN